MAFFTDRNRPESAASSIVMNEQYRQEQSRGNNQRRPSQGSITSSSTIRSNKGRNMAGYAIETSFCGAKPIIVASTYDLQAQQHSDTDRKTPPSQRINQSEESLTGKVNFFRLIIVWSQFFQSLHFRMMDPNIISTLKTCSRNIFKRR